METTEHFKNTIRAYLEQRATTDELFARTYARPDKNIEDCCTYILNTVQQTGCNGFADEEIYSMAVHYYDEDNIEPGKLIDCRVIVNHTVQLTPEEKAQARQKAMEQAQQEAYNKLMQSHKKKNNKQKVEPTQKSLF